MTALVFRWAMIVLLLLCQPREQVVAADEIPAQQSGSGDQPDSQPKRQPKKDESPGYPNALHGPHQKLKIDPADPPGAVARQWRKGIWNSDTEKFERPSEMRGLLQMVSRSGRVMWTVPCRGGGNTSGIGGLSAGVAGPGESGADLGVMKRGIAIDAERQRIYVSEYGTRGGTQSDRKDQRDQTTAFDFHGHRLWSITFLGSMIVDESTGNLWICRNDSHTDYDLAPLTKVFSSDGRLITPLPIEGVREMAYDRNSASIWLVGERILRLSSDFRILSASPQIVGWVPESVLVDDDGTVWVCESERPGQLRSANQVRQYSSDGRRLRTIPFPHHTSYLQPGPAGQLIVHGRYGYGGSTLSRATGKTSPLDHGGKFAIQRSTESGLWTHETDAISFTSFDGEQLFSVGLFPREQIAPQLKMRQEQAEKLASQFGADDLRVQRARQVVDDWNELLANYSQYYPLGVFPERRLFSLQAIPQSAAHERTSDHVTLSGADTSIDGETISQDSDRGPARFPVTVYGPQQHFEVDPADPPGAVAQQWRRGVYNTDTGEYEYPHEVKGLLQMVSRRGRVLWTVPCHGGAKEGFTPDSQGTSIDSQRQRIYVSEIGSWNYKTKAKTQADRIAAFDFHGQRLWSIDFEGPSIVDESTGNLWVFGYDRRTKTSETNVFDKDGRLLISLPIRWVRAMAYDRRTKSIWLVGHRIVHITSDFRILSASSAIAGWLPESALVDDDGFVWISEDIKPKFSSDYWKSGYRVRQLDSHGQLMQMIDFPRAPSCVEPGQPGELLIYGDLSNSCWTLNKSTGEIESCPQVESKFLIPVVYRGTDSGFWTHQEQGIAFIDFDHQQLFSVDLLTREDYITQQKIWEARAESLASELSRNHPRVRRALQVAEDWEKLLTNDSRHESESEYRGDRWLFNLRAVQSVTTDPD